MEEEEEVEINRLVMISERCLVERTNILNPDLNVRFKVWGADIELNYKITDR